jgi:hypothetical protein
VSTPAPITDENQLKELTEWLEVETAENEMWRAMYVELSHKHKLYIMRCMLLENQLADAQKKIRKLTHYQPPKRPEDEYPTIH